MCDWVVANFIVQCLILAGLIWYAVETRQIRMVSQKQIAASQEQIEALHKPCVTIATMARNAEDTILHMDELIGGMIVRPHQGDVALQNIGTGPAFNIHYLFERNGRPSINAYLPYIRAQEIFPIPLAVATLQLNEWKAIITYESLSTHRSRTTIQINNLVLTNFQFS